MEEFEKKDFEKLLKRGGLDARRYMKLTDSDVARVYDRNIGSIPVTVDLYGAYARVVDYSDNGLEDDEREEIKEIVSRYLYVERSKIVFKERKKREGREQHEKGDEEIKVVVKENGHEFLTELSLYTDTGLFLDQAYTRAMVENEVAGRSVLNLFSYTGSFSVYAASGGAESVVSVDLSNVYSLWAKDNLKRNGFLDEKKYRVVTEDAKSYLEKAFENGEKYDLVIFDPPAFSNSHKADDFDVQKDYFSYLYLISRILKDGGAVVFSENLSTFVFDKKELNRYWDIKEVTRDVLAQGFSSKKGSARVWILDKTATMKSDKKKSAVRTMRRMDEFKDESLDRLVLGEVEKKEEGKMDFPMRSEKKFDRGYSRENRAPRREGDRRRDDRDRFSDDRRERRYQDDRRERRYQDDRRDSRFDRDFRDRRDRDDRSYGRRDDRPSYSDRDRGYTSSRYRRDEDGSNETSRFYRGERRDSYRDDRRSSYRDRDRDYSSRSSYRDRDDRRPRFSEDRRDRSFSGERRDSYRSDDRFSSDRRDVERRKKSSPKPYGYDSFMSTSNRDKATAFWLSGQEVKKTEDDK